MLFEKINPDRLRSSGQKYKNFNGIENKLTRF